MIVLSKSEDDLWKSLVKFSLIDIKIIKRLFSRKIVKATGVICHWVLNSQLHRLNLENCFVKSENFIELLAPVLTLQISRSFFFVFADVSASEKLIRLSLKILDSLRLLKSNTSTLRKGVNRRKWEFTSYPWSQCLGSLWERACSFEINFIT